MKLKLAVALAVLLLSGAVRADGIDVGGAIIPDGSTITGTQPITVEDIPFEETFYSFSDGTGTAELLGPIGAVGTINFTEPVSDLTINWYGFFFFASDNLGDEYSEPICCAPLFPSNSPTGSAYFSGPGITSVSWVFPTTGEHLGIDSMTYTVDATDLPGVPEPSSLLLLGIGLAALIGLKLKP